MSEWIKHNGGPQPVADDVWVEVVDPIEGAYDSRADDSDWPHVTRYRILNQHLIDAARLEGLQKGLKAFDEARLAVEGDIQKLCDAARLEGIRLGLEAAAAKVSYWHDAGQAIRALDPETIARGAQGER